MKTLVRKDRLADTGCTIVNDLIKTPIPCVSYVEETDLVYFNNVVLGQGGYIPGPDTGDTPDTGSTPDTGDTPDTGSTPDTGDTPDTGSTPDTGDTPDTGSTPDTGETPDTGSVESRYLTFVALEDGTFRFSGNTPIFYSVDDGKTWEKTSNSLNIPVKEGDKVMWKGAATVSSNQNGVGRFLTTAKFNAYGEAMSIVNNGDFDAEITLKEGQFARLFSGSTIVSAENLVLPAEAKYRICYQMFVKCTSLVTSPVLSAEVTAKECYRGMFSGCTVLDCIKCLATTNIKEEDCTAEWTKGVAKNGIFFKSSKIMGDDWDRGDGGIPEGWRVEEI
jgi:hypothetical protein